MAFEKTLVLSAKRSTWRADDEMRAMNDETFRQVKQKVLKRDHYACCFCGFKSARWQEIHHHDGDHYNNNPDNLATICIFCHMVFHIGRAGLAGEAELVWLPEVSQAALSHVARNIYVGMRAKGVTAAASEALYTSIRIRAEDVRRRLGSSDPADLGEALLALDEKKYDSRAELLDGVRLMPLGRKYVGDKDVFPKVVDFWISAQGPFATMRPKQWLELGREAMLN